MQNYFHSEVYCWSNPLLVSDASCILRSDFGSIFGFTILMPVILFELHLVLLGKSLSIESSVTCACNFFSSLQMLAFDGKAEAAQFCFEKAAVRWAWKETPEIEASEKLAYARDARTGLFRPRVSSTRAHPITSLSLKLNNTCSLFEKVKLYRAFHFNVFFFHFIVSRN